MILQRRWEDEDGNIHATRVGTGRELLGRSTGRWVNGHRLKINYGDISGQPYYKPYMGLIPMERATTPATARAKMVPVIEEAWDSATASPTHLLVMFSAGAESRT